MDDELRTRAHAMRTEIEHTVDVDAAWNEFRLTESGLDRVTKAQGRDARRHWWLLGAAALTVGSVAASVVFVANGPDEIRTDDPATTPLPATTTPTVPSVAPGPTSVPEPPTTTPITEPTAAPAAPQTISVSYLSPPPAATPTVFASYVSTEQDRVVLGELGALKQSFGLVSIYGFDGSLRTVQLDEGLAEVAPIAYGPGDVMYGSRLVFNPNADIELVAVPLIGPRAGSIVESVSVGTSSEFTEGPVVGFGHGPNGIVSLAVEPVRELLGYVDETGAPLAWPDAPQSVASRDESDLVTAGDRAWQLAIERHPDGGDGGNSYTGPNGVAPGPGRTHVYGTTIGPLEDPTGDITNGTQHVIARLLPDGTGRWESIPDGWDLQSISPWGVLVTRLNPETFAYELALLGEVSILDPFEGLAWEGSSIAYNCVEEFVCTTIGIAADGTTASFDPTTRELTLHTVPSSTAAFPVEGRVEGLVVGPDDVVYAEVVPPTATDPVGDLVAIAMAPDDAGRLVRTWDGVLDMSGDTDLVPTERGIAEVGCCGSPGETVRPSRDAFTYEWVSRGGESITATTPNVEFVLDPPTLRAGEREWALDLSTDEMMFRGMPLAIATFDGGVIAQFETLDNRSVLVRGWPDGSTTTKQVGFFSTALDPTGVALAAGDEFFRRVDVFPTRGDDVWSGRQERSDDGFFDVPGLNEAIDAEAPSWANDPIAFANAIAGRPEVNETRVVRRGSDDAARTVVEVTTANLFDDSGSAVRSLIELSRDGDGTYRFVGGSWSQACQPGRGHQDFTIEPCL